MLPMVLAGFRDYSQGWEPPTGFMGWVRLRVPGLGSRGIQSGLGLAPTSFDGAAHILTALGTHYHLSVLEPQRPLIAPV